MSTDTAFQNARSLRLHPDLLAVLGADAYRVKARRLTALGTEMARAWYNAAKADESLGGFIVQAPPYALLTDDRYSEALGYDAWIDLRPLNTMRDTAEMVVEGFGANIERLRDDKGALDWITLARVDDLYPARDDGSRKAREPLRYLFRDYKRLASGHDMGYRHLVWASTFLMHDLGGRARMFLTTPADKPGDIIEQIMARPLVRSAPGLLEALEAMYYDERADRLVRGAKSVRKKSKASGAPRKGGIRDFIDIVRQFQRTCRVSRLTAEQIVALVPDDDVFASHKRRAAKKLRVQARAARAAASAACEVPLAA